MDSPGGQNHVAVIDSLEVLLLCFELNAVARAQRVYSVSVLYTPLSFPSVTYTSVKVWKSFFGFVYIVTQGYSGFSLVESVWNNLGYLEMALPRIVRAAWPEHLRLCSLSYESMS